MKASIKNNVLHLEIPLCSPRPSGSGKTLLVASETQVCDDVLVNGKPVKVAINAYIKP